MRDRDSGAKATCIEAQVDRIVVLAADDSGWLLLADSPAYRSGSAVLARFDIAAAPSFAELEIGNMEGDGGACGFAKSYCLRMHGVHTSFEVLSPSCVEIGTSTLWSAIHVRAEHRYAQRRERLAPPETEPKVGTYVPVEGKWVQASCPDKPVAQ